MTEKTACRCTTGWKCACRSVITEWRNISTASPWEYKDYRSYEKSLLRETMKEYLPEKILWRKKSPYPKMHRPAYLAAVSNLLDELVWDAFAPVWQIVRRD